MAPSFAGVWNRLFAAWSGSSHSFSFDHRRRPETLRTAIATAFFLLARA
jgi:hypothetical protein